MRGLRWPVVMFAVVNWFIPQACRAGELAALLEVKVGKDQFSGRIAAHNERDCWLMQRDGRLCAFHMDDVIDFHESAPKFKPFSSLDLRDHLQAEFGRDYEVKTSSHYVVVARRGGAERYAALFEQIYRQFHAYFAARGFRVSEPEFPLMAIVFPSPAAFVQYCQSEGTTPREGLVGYYLTTSNRVALYERSGSVDDTVIHEATHQIAFNVGVHSRIGQSPQWVVEGLATLFEADGIRERQLVADVSERINPERFEWFRQYRQRRRTPNSLEAFVKDDALFKRSALDAYSQAWALTFFLAETRPVEFAKYLKALSARDPLVKYNSAERLKDFRDAFGHDLDLLEMSFLRFQDRLAE